MKLFSRRALAAGVALLAAAPAARALRFDPVYIYLRRDEPATLVNLTNDGTVTTRYQVTVFAWSQDAQGEIKLTPTRDILFFPTVFALAPGEQRGIRIGTTASFTPPEKTYRVLIEELPADGAAAPARRGIQFQVRSRISLPIFVEPPNPVSTARIDGVEFAGGVMSAMLRSTGNAHLHLSAIRVAALGGSGEVVQERKWSAGYLLPGGEWRLSEAVPPERCNAVRAVRIDVETEHGSLTETLQAPKSACVR
jgi:fimbrial chaperone protein